MPKCSNKIKAVVLDYVGRRNNNNDEENLFLKNQVIADQSYIIQLLKERVQLQREMVESIKKPSEDHTVEDLQKMSKYSASVPFFDLDKHVLEKIKGEYLDPYMINVLNAAIVGDENKISHNSDPFEIPIAGSTRWKVHTYPGDIDMFQRYRIKAPTANDAYNRFIDDLVSTMNNIKMQNDLFLADAKVGFDVRFNKFVASLGQLKTKYVHPEYIEFFEKDIPGYNPNVAYQELTKLQSIMKPEDYLNVVNLFKNSGTSPKMTGKLYADVYSIIRKYHVLRWTIDEIINKQKNLNGAVINLFDCVQHDTIIKFDLWGKFNGRYTEITNILYIIWVNPAGNETVLSSKMTDYDASLSQDIAFYASDKHKNCVKLAKRLWNRAVYHVKEDNQDPTQYQIVKLIYPLFTIDINVVSQMKADIELLVSALKKKNDLKLPYDTFLRHLFDQIAGIPYKIFKLVSIPDDKYDVLSKKVLGNIDNIFNLFKQVNPNINSYKDVSSLDFEKVSMEQVLKFLDEIDDDLKEEQNAVFCKYLKELNLDPTLPNSYARITYTYNYLNL